MSRSAVSSNRAFVPVKKERGIERQHRRNNVEIDEEEKGEEREMELDDLF